MATYTGNTVEEAIERGLRLEKISRENAHIVIEQRESKGFLGVGKKRARVSIEPIEGETVRRADRMATRHVDQSDLEVDEAESAMEATLRLNKVVKAVREAGIHSDDSLTEEEKQEKIEEIKQHVVEEIHSEKHPEEAAVSESSHQEASSAAEEETRVSETVCKYLVDVTAGMGIETLVSYKKLDNGVIQFSMQSNHDALLIGKHGKILASLEVLTKALVSSIAKQRINVRVNVGDYQEKRERYLVSLAKRAAERALDGETVYINDLPAQERKIIHNTISSIDGAESHSEGRESKRYIVVSPSSDNID